MTSDEGKYLSEYNGFNAEDGQYFIHLTGYFRIIFSVFGGKNDTVGFTRRPNPSYKPGVVLIYYIIKEAGVDDPGKAELFYSYPVTASEPGFHAIAGYRNNPIHFTNNGGIYTLSYENRLFVYDNNIAGSHIAIV
jgi:hypothetical protein